MTALQFKDDETTTTATAYLVHYKIIGSQVEGSMSITTQYGIRNNGDDMDSVRRVIAESCNENTTITGRSGSVSPDQVLVLGWSAYTA